MGKKMDIASVIKPKRKCCKSGTRCKKCPVVCKRLMTQGYLEKRTDGRFVVLEVVPKKTLKAVRARG
jgi:aldehyde:ferredoxin oxidoreductase